MIGFGPPEGECPLRCFFQFLFLFSSFFILCDWHWVLSMCMYRLLDLAISVGSVVRMFDVIWWLTGTGCNQTWDLGWHDPWQDHNLRISSLLMIHLLFSYDSSSWDLKDIPVAHVAFQCNQRPMQLGMRSNCPPVCCLQFSMWCLVFVNHDDLCLSKVMDRLSSVLLMCLCHALLSCHIIYVIIIMHHAWLRSARVES